MHHLQLMPSHLQAFLATVDLRAVSASWQLGFTVGKCLSLTCAKAEDRSRDNCWRRSAASGAGAVVPLLWDLQQIAFDDVCASLENGGFFLGQSVLWRSPKF